MKNIAIELVEGSTTTIDIKQSLDAESIFHQIACGIIKMEYSTDCGKTFQDYTPEEAMKKIRQEVGGKQ